MEPMDQTMLTVLILVIFLIFFSALWLGVTTLLVRFSGSKRLSEAFPDETGASGRVMRWQTGAVGWGPITGVSFRDALNLDACSGGLRVSIMKLLAPFVQSIFVPWDKISVKERTVIAFDFWDLHFDSPDELRLMVTKRTGRKLVERRNGSLQPPD